MAGTIKTTDLPNAGVLTGTERVAVVVGNVTKQTTTLQISQVGTVSTPTASGIWCGNVTPTSFTVCFDVSEECSVGLVVSTNADLSNPIVTLTGVATPTEGVDLSTLGSATPLYFYPVKIDVTGLASNTTYYYAPTINTVLQTSNVQQMKTFPAAGQPASFSFAFGSCSFPFNLSMTPASAAQWQTKVFQAIARDNPLFFLHMGDIDYSDVQQNDVRLQRSRNSRTIRRNGDFTSMCRTVPFVYMYDDHDFAGNDSFLNSTYITKDAVEVIGQNTRLAARETIPLYPPVQADLGFTDINEIILTQKIDVGLIRFLIPDIRAQRRNDVTPPTCLGRGTGDGDYWNQQAWLLEQLAVAKEDGIKYIFLISTATWTGAAFASWPDVFYVERTVVCDGVQSSETPVCLLVGDAHESAPDDGANTGVFSTDTYGRFPQLMSSPLSTQGTLTAAGPFSWNGQSLRYQNNASIYCLVEVTHTNNTLSWTATFKGNPIDPTTCEPTTLGVVSSADAGIVANFQSDTIYTMADEDAAVPVFKSWFGPLHEPATVDWSDGTTSGTLTFLPNSAVGRIALPAKADGSTTALTISTPVNCTLGAQTTSTVNFVNADEDALVVANAMIVPPSSARVTLISNLIAALRVAGAWDKMEYFSVFAAASAQAALLNWKNIGLSMIPMNSPAFVADRGYAGNGATSYLDPQFNPLTGGQYQRNSAHIGVWSRTNSGSSLSDIGNGNASLVIRSTGNATSARLNSTDTVGSAATTTTSVGHFIQSRQTAQAISVYKDGVAIVSNALQNATGVTGTAFWVLGRNLGSSTPQLSTRQLSVAHWGAGLTNAEALATYNAINTYLVAVGAA